MKRPIRTASTHVLDIDVRCRCRKVAEFFLQLHKVNDCCEESSVSAFMCTQHLKEALAKLNEVMENADSTCSTCGRVLVTPSDVIIRIMPVG